MTQSEANKINALMKNVTNIQTLLADLLMPISAMIQKHHCTTQEACDMKLKAEDYLTKYGVLTLDSSVKAIKKMTSLTLT